MTTDEIIQKAKEAYEAQLAARTPEQIELDNAYEASVLAIINHSEVRNATSKALSDKKAAEFDEALKKYQKRVVNTTN